MKRYQLLLLTGMLLAGIFASCSSGDPMVKKYGLDFNQKRTELGLPVLQANWKLVKNTDGILTWAPEGNLQTTGFIHKQVTIKDDKIYGEENRFEGKNKYQRDGTDYTEEVYISCYFDDKEQISEWGCIFKGTRNPVTGSPSDGDTRITVKQADSIVTSWGIKY